MTPSTYENADQPGIIDTSVAHSARVYDYWLGGKDNYPADRALGDAIAVQIPTIRSMARANRAFMHRAVDHLVREVGIRQFLDIGTGIPTQGNVHEVAQAIAPQSRVVYVDNDPIVLVHARALLTSHPEGRTAFIDADIRRPDAILNDPELQATLDLDQPIALILVAILMLVSDADDPYGNVSSLIDALPSGSHVVISHPTADFDTDAMAGVVAASARAGFTFVPRDRAGVEAFFRGLELLEPGLVPVLAWRPDSWPPVRDSHNAYYWAGVARKP
ncbi:MAG: SAM-dependent methyltransferase [Pseudonocardiaceae bacterium]